jgi:hypothetical protein
MNYIGSRTIINPVGSSFTVNGRFSKEAEKRFINSLTNGFRESLQADNLLLLVMYARLAKYVETIQILFTEYTAGNFGIVANILTLSVYEEIALELNKLAMDEFLYPDYETLRKNYTYVIAGLYQSVLQYSYLVDAQYKLEQCNEKAEILNDPVKLKEYISRLKRSIFPETTIQTIKATIKPEYLEYIRLYGYPEGNVFDPDKLAQIIQYLNSSNPNLLCPPQPTTCPVCPINEENH